MDKTFDDIIGEVLEEYTNENEANNDSTAEETGEESTPEPEMEETDEVANSEDDSEDVDDFEDEDLESSDEEEEIPSIKSKDAEAFARMRTELKDANNTLKQNQEIIDFFDSRAKQMGLAGIDDLIAKTKESELKKQAESQGIPLDVLKRLNELEDKVKAQDLERETMLKEQKAANLDRIFDNFIQTHSMADKDINDLAQNMLKDGFTLEALSEMPEGAVNRILNSYMPSEVTKQEAIAKKERIKKELPPTGNTSSTNNTDSMIDEIAKQWAGLN